MRDLALEEIRIHSPFEVQQLLYSLDYLCVDSMKSAKKVWETGSAHCLEAVHLAAYLLEKNGYPPLALSLDSMDNVCHVVYVFRGRDGWGSLGLSREPGLHGRRPIFKNVRALAESYFDPYVDDTGKLVGYALVNLDDTQCDWRYSKRNVWKSEKYVLEVPHKALNCSRLRYQKAKNNFSNGGHPRQPYWW